MKIEDLSNTEANRELHESIFVNECWHTGKKEGLIELDVCDWFKCGKCDHESYYADFISRPTYSTQWRLLIPVITGLDDLNKKEFIERLIQYTGCQVHKIFDVTPRTYTNILLEMSRRDQMMETV